MKVKALREGFYGLKRRKVGAEFHIESEKHFSKAWMFAVDKKEMNEEAAQDPAQEQKVSSDMTVAELEDYCKEHGLIGYSDLKKKDLVKAINAGELEYAGAVVESDDVI